jgi:hypothetical protein
MDTLANYREIIERVLSEYAQIPYSYGNIQSQTVFDPLGDHYLLMNIGWDDRRVHGCLVHVDIIHDKIWIQRDGTEKGIATELVAAGVPKDRIVLGFRAPEIRKFTEYAVG